MAELWELAGLFPGMYNSWSHYGEMLKIKKKLEDFFIDVFSN